MPFPIRPAYTDGVGTPVIRQYQRGSGTAWTVIGAPVGIASGVIDEHAGVSTVTGILGFAMALPGTSPGYNAANSNIVLQVANSANWVPVAIATRSTVFLGTLTNGVTTTLSTPALANLRTYGIVKQSAGDWTVDSSDTTDVVVRVVAFDAANKLVWFKVIESALVGA